jgi:hypothetical protein
LYVEVGFCDVHLFCSRRGRMLGISFSGYAPQQWEQPMTDKFEKLPTQVLLAFIRENICCRADLAALSVEDLARLNMGDHFGLVFDAWAAARKEHWDLTERGAKMLSQIDGVEDRPLSGGSHE